MKKTFFLGDTEFEGIAASDKPHNDWVNQLSACADYADAIKAERAWFQSSAARPTRNPCGCLADCVMVGEFRHRCTECGAEWAEWHEDL